MRIGIIGAGKVGTAIGSVMKKRHLTVVAVSDKVKASLKRAQEYIGTGTLYTSDNRLLVSLADVIAVTTQDDVIGDVVREIHAGTEPLDGKLFFHTSGAHTSSVLQPLNEKGASLGSLHPLQTFPDIDSAIEVLPETYIFIEGDSGALLKLEALGKVIGAKTVNIEGKNKVLYHLAAVFVCNLLSALLFAGEGVMKKVEIEIEPFFPIIRATLRNIEKKGPLMSLTGPVVRGDIDTIVAHIEAMTGMDQHRDVYRALSLVAVEMVRQRGLLDEDLLERMRRVLEKIR